MFDSYERLLRWVFNRLSPRRRRRREQKARRRLMGVIWEAREALAAKESRNKDYPHRPPVDCEVQRVVLFKARSCLAALDRGHRRRYARLRAELIEYGRKVLEER